jgi:2,4-dienoyl-CoA reductase-like NADH-dependent reductase (Old Yellow Enzyme family)
VAGLPAQRWRKRVEETGTTDCESSSRDSSAVAALFRPIQIAGLTLANRIVMSPMTRSFSPGGVPGEGVEDYYRRRAENDVGLIVTEGVGVDHPAAIGKGTMGEGHLPLLHGDTALARWKAVVDEVHGAGGLIFPQLWHQGVIRIDNTGPYPDVASMRPSGIWGPSGRHSTAPAEYLDQVLPPTRAMTEEDIADVIAGFARSAANARAVGFDGIAIHGAHGYLPDTFLWKETNRRTDAWGGDVARRNRFAIELVKAIRAEVGPLPIMLRYSPWKQQDYDAKLADTPTKLEAILGPIADAGVDIFDASTRYYHQPAFDSSPLTLAGWTKKLTGKPTMAVGGIGLNKELKSSFFESVETVDNLPDVAQRIDDGEFDLAGVGRSLLVDPAWARKAREGAAFAPFNLAAFDRLY